jgi:hypothetical protein
MPSFRVLGVGLCAAETCSADAGTQLILLGCLTYPHQIPERLGSGVWYPCCRQISGSMTARPLQGNPPISLDPAASLDRNQRRSSNLNNYY